MTAPIKLPKGYAAASANGNLQTAGPLRMTKDKYGEQTQIGSPRGCVALVRAGALVDVPANAEENNAKLLMAAYNAFDGAARRLGVDAAELATKLGADGLVALIEAYNAPAPEHDAAEEHASPKMGA